MEFLGTNLRIARQFKGLTQDELAAAVSVSTATIWGIEQGRQPSASVVDAIAIVLEFNREFFFRERLTEYTPELCFFRSSVTASERVRKKFLARGSLFAQLVRFLRDNLRFQEFRVPAVPTRSVEDAERAADRCRVQLGLDLVSPIGLMSRVLESNGVMLVRVKGESAKLDAFSTKPEDGVSFVVISSAKDSPSRSRFDMAHELGHLVMHRDVETPTPEREKEADRFASAFLLPREGFVREFRTVGGAVDWPTCFALKARWGASVQAIVHRAYDLGLIDAVQYRRAYKAISAKGWRKKEPMELKPEQPELFVSAMTLLRERRGLTLSDIAGQLGWHPTTMQNVLEWTRPEPAVEPATPTLTLIRTDARRVVAG